MSDDYWAKVDRRRQAYGHEPYGTAQAKVLAEMMEFDHVVEVLADEDGTTLDVIDRNDLHAPELLDSRLEGDRWSLMNGYSLQHSYAGPIMHPSEYIGGPLARDILSTPGVYVSLVSYFTLEEGDDDDTDGWAVARLEQEETP